MTAEQLREVHQTKPFAAFSLQLADGNEVDVPHPEFMMFMRDRRSIIVALPRTSYKVIDIMHITSIHVGNGKPTKPRRRRS